MSDESCKLISAIFAVPNLFFLTVLGLLTNSLLLHFYKKKRITDKDCSQYFLIACAILDFSWNTLPVLFVIWHDTSSYLVESDFFSQRKFLKRLISHVCCFYVFCSITLFTLMAFDRVMAVRNPLASKFRTKKNILLQLCVLSIGVIVIGFLTWFWYGFYFLVYTEAILIGVFYMYILKKIKRVQTRSMSMMGGHLKRDRKELSLTKVIAINTWVSILICIPCTLSIMLKFPLQPYVHTSECVPFVLMMLLHHPLMCVNYAIHPITYYLTMRSFRRHVHRVVGDLAEKIGWHQLSELCKQAEERGTLSGGSTKVSRFVSNLSPSQFNSSTEAPVLPKAENGKRMNQKKTSSTEDKIVQDENSVSEEQVTSSTSV